MPCWFFELPVSQMNPDSYQTVAFEKGAHVNAVGRVGTQREPTRPGENWQTAPESLGAWNIQLLNTSLSSI